MCVITAKRLWPYAFQTTSECGLGDQISMRPQRIESIHTLELSNCDRFTQDACSRCEQGLRDYRLLGLPTAYTSGHGSY